ncbi:MAG: hypothetical protein E5V91_10160 [Mesorhizobium sp.]|uniref:hypothetical protein n=1 Tax=unclassified Mesorhizobium TaxID=325217 RepID=UPI000FCB7D57|nr:MULTISPECIES: hypothetical protein [unclassified Mesorhizobium]RUW39374.1 hypothetical protein EOA37_19965 [Mesorhizobium sp. M2A.F.Ca.ET.015.02.1.1]RUW79971.1 hypothetical protein EOA28_06385 [Mesorhizobium sp. M2A.F.Ca.ET.067.02.1.1]RVC97834.1 hypothetical protein EN739_02885 [Mesorhizobium sp. M2A.F.Ca.ET.017.03.2.1]RVD07028.1 hypothetical protein EN753_17970 [Mesorhizobium sp. M2A.F.Ca.ET.029.05.1.1]RWB46289.1 MAG: hypothetical protein EOQ46_08360 [Mesorhizobium sp.]
MFLLDRPAGTPLLHAESIVFLCFTALKMAQAARNVANATPTFESLSFPFAGFLGFAAPARAAH